MSINIDKKHLARLEDKQELFFTASQKLFLKLNGFLSFYYLATTIISLVIFYFCFAIETKNLALIKILKIISANLIIFSIANYLNLLYKNFINFHNSILKLYQKYNQEIYILKKFNAGEIDTKKIRKFYLNEAKNTKQSNNFNSRPSLFSAWLILVFLSVAIILLAIA